MRDQLTEATIKSSAPGDVLRDHVVLGLHLRAFAKRRSFYLYYRTRGGKQRKPKLGDWPTLSLAQARKLAKDQLYEVAGGGDPQGVRVEARAAPTIAQLADRYMEEHGNAKKSGLIFPR